MPRSHSSGPGPLLLAVALAALPHARAAAEVASFQGVGDLPGGVFSSAAAAVSADGSTVIGEGEVEGVGSFYTVQGFRWTAAGGMEQLVCDPEDFRDFECKLLPSALSADGSVVVGAAATLFGIDGIFSQPFRQVQDDPAAPLPAPLYDSWATDVSAAGDVVVGISSDGELVDADLVAFRWTEATGSVDLGDGGEGRAQAAGVSADGSVVVGTLIDVVGKTEAFRWSQAGGVVALGGLPEGVPFPDSSALAISGDGQVIVGTAGLGIGNGLVAFRWTQAAGMQSLGDLAGGGDPDSRATGANADGSVIVGRGESASGYDALVWTPGQPPARVQDVLEDAGLDLTGWTLRNAADVSADGRTIVGTGVNPDGFDEAWIAFLPAPEPGAAAGAGAALATLALLGRRRRGAAVR